MTSKRMETISDVIAARREKLAIRADFINLIVRIAIIIAAAYLFFTQMFLVTQVRGMDMFPALKDGDLSIVFRLHRDYAKNDVVAYRTADGMRFGRIVAREGDVVVMNDGGSLQVNGTTQGGEILYPTYALEGIEYPYRVPEGSIFVLGDYRTKATDSRIYGSISMEDVAGKVITILRRRGL